MPFRGQMSVYGHKEMSFQAQYEYMITVEWLYDAAKPNKDLHCGNKFAHIFHCHICPGPLADIENFDLALD